MWMCLITDVDGRDHPVHLDAGPDATQMAVYVDKEVLYVHNVNGATAAFPLVNVMRWVVTEVDPEKFQVSRV